MQLHAIEVFTLTAGLLVLTLVLRNRQRLAGIPGHIHLIWGLAVLVCGWVFGVLDQVGAPEFFVALEHAAYACSSLAMVAWLVAAERAGWQRRRP